MHHFGPFVLERYGHGILYQIAERIISRSRISIEIRPVEKIVASFQKRPYGVVRGGTFVRGQTYFFSVALDDDDAENDAGCWQPAIAVNRVFLKQHGAYLKPAFALEEWAVNYHRLRYYTLHGIMPALYVGIPVTMVMPI